MEKDNSNKSKQSKKGSSKAPQKNKKAKKKNKKDKILKAATKLFSEHPYHSASMRMIAKEAGIDHPLIIYYFPTKGNLFETVFDELIRKLSLEMPIWFKGLGNMSLSKGISTYLDRAMDYHRVNPEIMRIMLLNMTQPHQKSDAVPAYQHIQKAFDLGAKVFKQGSRFNIKPGQMSLVIKGVSIMMTNLMGAREYHAEIQGLDPKSDAYFKWAKDVIMFMLLPVLNSFELKE